MFSSILTQEEHRLGVGLMMGNVAGSDTTIEKLAWAYLLTDFTINQPLSTNTHVHVSLIKLCT